jgi:WD40 repeat protein
LSAHLSVRELVEHSDALLGTVSGWLAGQHAPTTASKDMFVAVLNSCGVTDPADVDAWWAAVRRARRKVSTRSVVAPTPYRGFESFQTEDKDWFFGRSELTDRLIAAVTSIPDTERHPMVMIVGPSGAGKSSVLRAGLLANIGSDATAGWRSAVMTPGIDPMTALRSALDAVAGESGPLLLAVDQFEELWTLAPEERRQKFLQTLFALDDDGATDRDSKTGSDNRRVVVVGALRADYYGRAAGHPALVPVLQNSQIVVPSMSHDQLEEVIRGPARHAGLDIDDDLVQMLLSDVDPAFNQSGAAALPMLSHALLATWTRSDRRRLTSADYLATGRISGAVERTAEAVYSGLADEDKDIARRQLLALVNVDDEWVHRRKAPLEALGIIRHPAAGKGAGNATDPGPETVSGTAPESAARAAEVLERFAAARLVTVDAEYAEVTHEALLTAWPRLREWIDGDRANLLFHRRLRTACELWESAGRPDELLIRGSWLGMVNDFVPGNQRGAPLTPAEAEFLEASNKQQQRIDDDERHRVKQLRSFAYAVGVIALVAAIAAALAVVARSQAVDQRNRAENLGAQALSRQLAVQSQQLSERDPALARQLAMIAYRTSATVEARSTLVDNSAVPTPARFLGPVGPIAVEPSPDDRLLAIAGVDNRVRLFSTDPGAARIERGAEILGGLAGEVRQLGGDRPDNPYRSLAFSNNSMSLAAGGAGAIDVWTLGAEPTSSRSALPTAGAVNDMEFSPDGTFLVAAVEGAGLQAWQASGSGWTPVPVPSGIEGTGQAVAFSPDGSMLATSTTTSRVDLWTVSASVSPSETASVSPSETASVSPSETASVSPSETALISLMPMPSIALTEWADNEQALTLAFTPSGDLAMGLRSRQVRIYTPASPDGPVLRTTLEGFGNYVNGIDVSADGRHLVAAGSDNTVREFDLHASDDEDALTRSWRGPSVFTGAHYIGDHVVSTAGDGVVDAWGPTYPMIQLGADTVYQIPAAADGSELVAGGGTHGEMSRVSLSDGPQLARTGPDLTPPAGQTFSGAIGLSRSGRLAALGTADGTVHFADLTRPEAPALVGPGVRALPTLNETVDINETTGVAVTGGLESNGLAVLDVADLSSPKVISRIDVGAGITWASLGPDGRKVAVTTGSGAVALYDLSDPAAPQELSRVEVFESEALCVRFSADGRNLVVTSSTKELATLDISVPERPGVTARMSGPVGQVYSGGYSADGTAVVVGGGAGEVWIWDVREPRNPRLHVVLRAFGGRVFDVRFAEQDHTVLAAGEGGRILAWTVDIDVMLDRACANTGDQITRAEWQQYLPQVSYEPPCGG